MRSGAFRFLHVSTDEVYGALGDEGLFTEDTPYAPTSPYAASKASADHLVRAYGLTYGLPVVITNCSNNYGPVPVSREADSADDPEWPRRPSAADLRRRRQRARLAACRGSLLPASCWRSTGDGRARSTTSAAAANGPISAGHRLCDSLDELRPPAANPALGGASSYRSLKTLRRRIDRGTIGAMPSTRARFGGSSDGRRATISRRACARPFGGTSNTGTGAAGCRPGATIANDSA